MPLFLKSESKSTLAGLTLYSDPLLGGWAKPTGVYVPPSADIDKGVVNILLWLHGWYVKNIEDLFTVDRSAVRQQVLSSGKSVVLVAPYLGKGFKGEGSSYSVAALKDRWGELYINQVLNALAPGRKLEKQRSNLTLEGLAQTVDFSPGLRLGKLVIACHSAGGAGMRNLVGALGQYKANLAECWGFDCLYRSKTPPDDASFWHGWVTGEDGRPLHISYGSSTALQSVKLDLMGQGLATKEGARRNPKGSEVSRLNVKLGITSARSTKDLMRFDDLLEATTPKPGKPSAIDNKFTEQAAKNLKKNAGWPEDLMEMHYQIAREGLFGRLKGADFL